MHALNAYRCRDGHYLLAPACIDLGGKEQDGLLSYLGSVCPEQFGDELGAWIVRNIAEHEFVRIAPDRFYSDEPTRLGARLHSRFGAPGAPSIRPR